jgi:hypothetical protein
LADSNINIFPNRELARAMMSICTKQLFVNLELKGGDESNKVGNKRAIKEHILRESKGTRILIQEQSSVA